MHHQRRLGHTLGVSETDIKAIRCSITIHLPPRGVVVTAHVRDKRVVHVSHDPRHKCKDTRIQI